MKNLFSTFFGIFMLVLLVTAWNGCVDLEFDTPPATPLCDWTSNTSIAELKAMHVFGQEQVIEEDMIISGVVIADDESGNFYRNIVVQDETGGIEIRFTVTELYNDYPIGRRVFVNCKDLTLSDYNGLIQLGEIPEALIDKYVCKGELGQEVEPTTVKIADLNPSHVSTLIRLENVQFANGSAGETFADGLSNPPQSVNLNIVECDTENTIALRTSGYSDFANEIAPAGSGEMVAVYSVFNQSSDPNQLYIRDPSDIEFDDERCLPGNGGGEVDTLNYLFENFESVADDENLEIPGWYNLATEGTRLWRGNYFGGDDNTYAQATAFQDNNPAMETWLITPPINLDEPKNLSFLSGMAFYNHDGLSVWLSTDFSGSNLLSANWIELDCELAGSGDNNYDWVPSGIVDLSAYSGVGHIAFKYEGAGDVNTTSYLIDDVLIENQ